MVKKKEVQQENEELKKENKRIKKEKADLEEKVDFLKSELEKEELIKKTLKREIMTLEQKLGKPKSKRGKVTTILTCSTEAGHYLFDEKADRSRAEEPLDIMVSLAGIKGKEGIPIMICTDRDGKKQIRFNKPDQEEIGREGFSLTGAILNIYDSEKARTTYYIYKKIIEAKNKNPHLSHPNLPWSEVSGKYFVQEKIEGTDLFIFFKQLDEKPPSHTKSLLIDCLVNKQIKDLLSIRRLNFYFDKNLIIRSSHEKKALEVFEEAEILLKKDEKEKLISLIKPFNSRAKYPLRDNASWNYNKIKYVMGPATLDDFLGQELSDPDEIRELVDKRVYFLDWDKALRMTFQSDDIIHTLEWPLPILSPEDRRKKEEYFVRKLSEHGENTEHYWDLRALEGFYRHIRMWFFYRRNQENYPDPDNRFKQHHLNMAFRSLYTHTFGKTPLEKEIANTDLKKVLKLVMHPDCRP